MHGRVFHKLPTVRAIPNPLSHRGKGVERRTAGRFGVARGHVRCARVPNSAGHACRGQGLPAGDLPRSAVPPGHAASPALRAGGVSDAAHASVLRGRLGGPDRVPGLPVPHRGRGALRGRHRRRAGERAPRQRFWVADWPGRGVVHGLAPALPLLSQLGLHQRRARVLPLAPTPAAAADAGGRWLGARRRGRASRSESDSDAGSRGAAEAFRGVGRAAGGVPPFFSDGVHLHQRQRRRRHVLPLRQRKQGHDHLLWCSARKDGDYDSGEDSDYVGDGCWGRRSTRLEQPLLHRPHR
mmetsp:Transcript_73238/g.147431  ORF Transcript_73238/g.147431 Transcript_73238/m.147431 type:complete len:296 (-) Transcript_73238:846-1733(-)